MVLEHRHAWELAYGPIPKGMVICHTCDNTRCVNISHLFMGTQADNMRDMREKGRAAYWNRVKSNCPEGHPYDKVNAQGRRICTICVRVYRAAWRRRRKESV